MNAITNAFKRAHGVKEEDINNDRKASTGHRKLLAENIIAKPAAKVLKVDKTVKPAKKR